MNTAKSYTRKIQEGKYDVFFNGEKVGCVTKIRLKGSKLGWTNSQNRGGHFDTKKSAVDDIIFCLKENSTKQ